MDAYIILDERDLANNNNNTLFVSLETFCKYSFSHFPVSSSIKKIGQWKPFVNIVWGQRTYDSAHFPLGPRARVEESSCRE